MSKKRKNGELPKTIESLKSRNEELEAQNMTLMARIQQFEQEIRQLKENCKCPKDIAGNFRIVPLLAMRKIFEFLSFDDLKELRCVSSWFFTTVSYEFESLFGTYHIKLKQTLVSDTSSVTGMKWKLKVPKEVDAIIRPGVKLAYNLDMWDGMGAPDADFVQEIHKYKNNITEINIALCHDNYDFLLEEDFHLINLERMNIDMKYCKYIYCSNDHLDLVKDTCSDFISRYANQLLHLSFSGMDDWTDLKEPHEKVAYLPNLKSLSHKIYWDRDASFLIKSVNFANVTKLEIGGFVPRNIDITDLNIRNLSVLSLDDVDEQWLVMLLKSNSSTLTKLKIGFDLDDLDDCVFNDIQFSKLKYLNINGMNETDALTLIQSSKNTIAEIHLSKLHTYLGYNNLESVTFLQLPHLKKVHLDIGFKHILSSKLVNSLINACDENTLVRIKDEKINKSLLEELREKFMSDAY